MNTLMRKAVVVSLLALVAVSAVAVEKIHIQLVSDGQKLSAADVARIGSCKLVFHIKAGMTNAEANAAIDAGYQKWFACLKHPGVQ